jgi:hypothetical protein
MSSQRNERCSGTNTSCARSVWLPVARMPMTAQVRSYVSTDRGMANTRTSRSPSRGSDELTSTLAVGWSRVMTRAWRGMTERCKPSPYAFGPMVLSGWPGRHSHRLQATVTLIAVIAIVTLRMIFY